MLKRAFKVAYIRRKNKQFGKLNKSGAREFSTAEYKEQIKTLNRLLENQKILTKQAQDQNQNLLLENVEIKKELN
ncbi:hypothetical protein ACI3RH_07935 [Lactococcus lactis]